MLTASNCTEDERFIFQYLDKKREIRAAWTAADEDNDVDDDEFDAYLDSLGGKKKKGKNGEMSDDEEFDFLGEMGGESEGKPSKKSRKNVDEDDDDWDGDDDGGNSDGDDDG